MPGDYISREEAQPLMVFLLLTTSPVVLVFSWFYAKLLFFICAGVLIGSASRTIGYLMKIYGFELCSFISIMTGFAFGSWFAALLGFTTIIPSRIITRESRLLLGISSLFFALTGAIAGSISVTASNLVFYGILLSVFYNISSSLVYFFIVGYPLPHAVKFSTVNLALNIFLFIKLGPKIFLVMQGI